jgi:DNA-directed RNA polymerase subunit L
MYIKLKIKNIIGLTFLIAILQRTIVETSDDQPEIAAYTINHDI